ncbi:hypothetical protein PsYK624_062470 [Phanerochaete sordida]|uniref:Uncharacterized protein n=1 Tax=Phanerochaete sordida TaxID=48140 RepID=A0A9P3GA22_9APHY|nr:hypothetical protein PsYK624_062470 [Phanerochaete sordida]
MESLRKYALPPFGVGFDKDIEDIACIPIAQRASRVTEPPICARALHIDSTLPATRCSLHQQPNAPPFKTILRRHVVAR